MARGTQLLQLVAMLRSEIGRSSSVAVGVDDQDVLKRLLRRAQTEAYDEYEWPFLKTVFDRIPLQAGQRYYDFPTSLNFDRIIDVAVWDSNQPLRIVRGIGFEEYAVYDSENDARAEPALRWDVRWTGTTEQIEIWPVPSTNNQALQFIGIRKLRDLIEHADVADLDDELIVLRAAGEALAEKDKDKAKLKLDGARARFSQLRRNSGAGNMTYRMGSGQMSEPDRGRTVVRVSR